MDAVAKRGIGTATRYRPAWDPIIGERMWRRHLSLEAAILIIWEWDHTSKHCEELLGFFRTGATCLPHDGFGVVADKFGGGVAGHKEVHLGVWHWEMALGEGGAFEVEKGVKGVKRRSG